MTPKSTRQYNIDAGIPSSVGLLGGFRVSSADGPDTIELTGIVRDSQEHTAGGGHPDFEPVPHHGLGLDGSTGFYGIKWDVSHGFADQVFTIILDGHFAGGMDDEGVLAKAGHSPDRGAMFVPTATVSETGSPYPSGPVFAERHRTQSNFTIETNLSSSRPPPRTCRT